MNVRNESSPSNEVARRTKFFAGRRHLPYRCLPLALLKVMVLEIILLPALIAMAMLNFMTPARVATRLYIPCLIFFPVYLTFPLGGFLMSDTTLVVMLLCGAGLVRWYRSLRLTVVDVCVLLYAFSAFFADARQRPLNIAFYVLCKVLAQCVFPYYVGRTLIEQTNSRREFAKSIAACFAILAIISVYEFRMEYNFFQNLMVKLSGVPSVFGFQGRWGFQRIAGPFGHAIFAGMMFSMGLMMQLWLAGTKSWGNSRALRFLPTERRGKVVTFAVCMGFFMTQSRGPWIGCGFGLILASIGFAKDRRHAARLTIFGLIVAFLVTGVILDRYTSEQQFTAQTTGDENQQNAAYRRELLTTYTPLIAQGGIWGWGTPQIASRGGFGWSKDQISIDNEYILCAMAQGYFGVTVFAIILIASIYRAGRLAATFRNRQDFLIAYCLLGAVFGMSLTIATAALGDPVFEIFFMFLGWIQSLKPTGDQQEAVAPTSSQPFSFKRVFA